MFVTCVFFGIGRIDFFFFLVYFFTDFFRCIEFFIFIFIDLLFLFFLFMRIDIVLIIIDAFHFFISSDRIGNSRASACSFGSNCSSTASYSSSVPPRRILPHTLRSRLCNHDLQFKQRCRELYLFCVSIFHPFGISSFAEMALKLSLAG